MLFKIELLKSLRSIFDLNIYEVKIWLALLSRGVSTAGELADISNVPRSRSYDVLESLEKRGFIIMKVDKPIKYIAVHPEEIIKRLKSNLQKEAESQIEELEKAKTTSLYDEIDLLFKNGINHVDPTTLSGAIKGRRNLYHHIESMLCNAKKEVVIATTLNGMLRKLKLFNNTLRKLKGEKIRVRILVPHAKENTEAIKKFSDIAEIRLADKLNARFVIIDSKEIIFMTSDDSAIHENYDSGIWVSSPYFAKAMQHLFDLNWEKA